jgi:hypothetical protein
MGESLGWSGIIVKFDYETQEKNITSRFISIQATV